MLLLPLLLPVVPIDLNTTTTGAMIGGPRFINWLLIIYTLVTGGFAGVLLAFHCKLIYLNVSTNEYLKDRL